MNRIIMGLLLSLAPVLASGELKIVTTAPDFADLAKQIGGDKVSVHSVMKGPENVHNVMAKPPEMLALNKADMFVHGGLDSEPWRDNLLKGARNPRVLAGQPGNVDMSEGIELKEVPAGKVDRSMGDVHAYGNPHFQLDPRCAARMAVTLAKAMAAVDPANGDFYKANAKKFVIEVTDLQKQLTEKLKPFGKLKIVTFHPGWVYFEDAFGVQVVATIEPKPMITPSPAEMRKVVETMKSQGVKIVVVETYSSYDQAKWVADHAGAKLITLPDHVNGVEAAKTYQDLFRYDVETLVAAAKELGLEGAGK
jgi:zinc/manganese transport system substrate-binding protein